jgi:serine protease AprX
MNKFKSAWLAAASLGVASLGGAAVPAAAVGQHGASTHWESWLGASTTDAATTLKQVRTYIGADTGTAANLTGKGVGVALIDTGVAPVAGLPAAQVVNGPDLSFESQAANLRYLDTFGHGTHMAGIIVGKDTATGTNGIAPGVKLTSIKVGTANGAVDVTQVIAAVDWVVAHRNDDTANPIKVINLSYGSGGTPWTYDDSLGFAVEKAWKAGIVVVAAAGNDGNNAGNLANPAIDEFILSVGSVDTNGTTSTGDDELTTFTNQPLGGKQVNVLAPGVSILSLRDPGSSIDAGFPAARTGDTLFRGTGTSQSAAVTSAAVALIRQSKPTATPDQIKDALINTATLVPNGIARDMGLKDINVNAAIARIGTVKLVAPTWNPSSGAGQLDSARGSSRVVIDNVALSGQKSVWGPLTTSTWASKSAAGTAWSGGTWMGFKVAGDGWTGTSWAAKTWASATWSNSAPWSGQTSWTDSSWTGRAWTGRAWTAGSWTGRAWCSDDWSSAYWG